MRVITLKAENSMESIIKHYAIVGETAEHFEQHRRYMVIGNNGRPISKRNRYIVDTNDVPATPAYTAYAKALALYVRLSDEIKQASAYVEYGLTNVISHTGYTDTIVTDADVVSASDNLPALKRALARVVRIMDYYRAQVVAWLQNEYSHED